MHDLGLVESTDEEPADTEGQLYLGVELHMVNFKRENETSLQCTDSLVPIYIATIVPSALQSC